MSRTITARDRERFREDAKIPILVGVIGHRQLDPRDLASLESSVQRGLAHLNEAFPRTPVVVCSQLAEGADRIGARAALAGGHDLLHLAPLPDAAFSVDFEAPNSAQEFERLAKRSTSARVETFSGTNAEALSLDSAARGREFHKANRWMVANCSVLIAMWDGEGDLGEGGTAQTVHEMLEGVRETPGSELIGQRPVFQIPSRRAGGSELEHTSPHWRFPKSLAKDISLAASLPELRMTNRFNAMIAASSAYWLDRALATAEETRRGSQTDEVDALSCRFAMADALSLRAQENFHRTTKLVLTQTLIAIACFSLVNSILEPGVLSRIVAAIYLAILSLSLSAFLGAKRNRYQHDYLERRSLAEGLRVQLAWNALGVKADVADHYLLRQVEEVNWVRRAIRVCSAQRSVPMPTGPRREELADWALSWWIKKEFQFYTDSTASQAAQSAKIQRLVTGSWVAAIVAGVLALLAHLLGLNSVELNEPGQLPSATQLLGVLATFGFALAGFVGNWEEKLGLAVQSRVYHRMSAFFDEHMPELMACRAEGSLDSMARIAEIMGKEALTENGIWLGMQLSRRLDSPSG